MLVTSLAWHVVAAVRGEPDKQQALIDRAVPCKESSQA